MVTGTEPTKSPTSNGVAAQAAALQQTLLPRERETRHCQIRQRRTMGRQASHRIGESRGCADAEADMPAAEASGARCVQNFDGSRNSAIHTTYRISLRSSSIREPRYPLLRVVVWFGNLGRQRPRDASEANTTHTIVVSWCWVGVCSSRRQLPP